MRLALPLCLAAAALVPARAAWSGVQTAAPADVRGTAVLDSEYRPDLFLPKSEYDEPNPDPKGARFFVTGTAEASGSPDTLFINGVRINTTLGQNETTWPVDFYHVLPSPMVQGKPFFVVFHTRQPEWHVIPSATLLIEDASGATVVNGSFAIDRNPPARITTVTTSGDGSSVIVHVRTNLTTLLPISGVTLNGAAASQPWPTLPGVPGQTVMLQLPAAPAVPMGGVITVKVSFSGGASVIAAARRIREFYPSESWVRSADCPFPTVNDTNYAIHRAHGVDTFFTDDVGKCNITEQQLVNDLAPAHDFWVMAGKPRDLASLTNTSRVAGFFLGDEDDDHSSVTDNLRKDAHNTRELWGAFPGIPTYVGGSRNRFRGAWANSVDALGMDAYIAACAPHVTQWGLPANPRFSFDYLRVTRDNQAPWPTWLYSQAFDAFWNVDILGVKVIRQPDPAELAVSLQSVVAAGAKGLFLFQTEIDLMAAEPRSWALLGSMVRELVAMREVYRQGDQCGDVDTGGAADLVAAAQQSPRALTLTLINLQNSGGYSDLSCELAGNDHWNFTARTVDAVTFAVPAGWPLAAGGFADAFELVGGAVVEVGSPYQVVTLPGGGKAVRLTGVKMTGVAPGITRTVVFSNDASLRAEVKKSLIPWSG